MGKTVSKAGRQTAVFIAVMILACVLCSAVFLAAEAGHDCSGDDDCPVCSILEMCSNNLRRMAEGALCVLACVAMLPLCVSALCIVPVTTELTKQTPVSQKVRLNR